MAPGLGQPREDLRSAVDPPDEVVAASAQNVERLDAVVTEDAFHRHLDRFLQGESAGRIEVGLGREVEIDIFDVEVGDERIAVGQRAANVASGLELCGQFPRQEGGAFGEARRVGRDVFRGEVPGLVGTEELQHALPHGGLAVVVAQSVENVGHVERRPGLMPGTTARDRKTSRREMGCFARGASDLDLLCSRS